MSNPSVNKNFVVQNGLTVGEMTIFAGNSDIRTSGNITVTGTGTINVPSIGVSSIAINDSSIAINDTGPTGSTIELTLDNVAAGNVSASGMNLPTGTAYQINQIDVLSYNTLKSGVVNSSLTSVGTLQNLTVTGNTAINNTLYGRGIYDNSNRVVSTSSGLGNLTISGAGINLNSVGPGATTVGSSTAIPVITLDAYGRVVALTSSAISTISTSTGSGNLNISGSSINLSTIGPGATTVGSGTAIPVITTDAYGRVVALTSSSVSTTINLSGTSGTGSVAGGGTLTFAGSYGVTASASTSTITIATSQDLQTTASPTFTGLTTSANTIHNSTMYARGVYDNSNRVVSTSSGAGNLTISGTGVNLTSTGPGAVTTGSSTAIPVITTDAYGRVVALTSSAISTSFTVAGTSGTATVSGGSTLTLAGTYGVTVAVGATYANISTPQDLQTTASPTFTGLTTSANTIVNSTLYARGVYDNSVRVVSTSSGAGNLSISGTAITLPSTGPGAASVGSSTAIPVITTDAYGRVASTSTAAVVAPAGTLSGSVLASGVTEASLTTIGTLTALTVSGVTKPNANATVNLGATNAYWNNFYAVASNFNQSTIGGQGLSSAGIVTITNNSGTTSAASGALQVTGGVGIGGNIYVTGISTLAGNVNIGGNLTVTGQSVSIGTSDLAIQDPIINLHTFANLQALIANDGADIGIKIHYYDNADRAGFFGRTNNDGYLTYWAQGTDAGNLFTGTQLGTIKGGAGIFSNTTTSTSTTTGALQVGGGAGIAGAVYAGSIQNTPIGSTTASTGAFTTLTTSGNTAINNTLYAQGVYDNSNRVVSTSSGTGNLSISGTAITLPSTGPGAVTTGSGTAIPVITTDAYGRISTISTAALTAITNLSSSGTGNITVSAATGSSTLSLPSTGPGATSVGSSTAIPVITTDAYGRIASTSTAAVVAPAGTLSGSTLASGVTASGLTSVGTLTGLTVSGSITPNANLTVNLGNSTSYYGTVFAGQYTGNTFTVGGGGLSSSGNISTTANTISPNFLFANGVNILSSIAPTTTYTSNIAINTPTNSGLTTTQTTAYVFNENATTLNIGRAATTINIGAATGSIVPAANAAVNLGSSTAYYGTVFAGQHTGNTFTVGGGGLSSSGSITPSANVTQNLGSTTAYWGTTYTGQLTANSITVGGGGTTHNGPVSPAANVTYNLGSTTAYWGTTYTGQVTANTLVISAGTANAAVLTGNVYVAGSIIPFTSNATYNFGTTNSWWGTYYGVSTQAKYADLAENYQADTIYEPGTVLMFGGEAEVTLADADTTAVAGVVSTNPAHLMNGALQGARVVPLALQGRVPCKVIGPIAKGDILVSAGFGFAKTAPDRQLGMKFGQAIGKALENVDPGTKATIEVVVGRV